MSVDHASEPMQQSSPVKLPPIEGPTQPPITAELTELYRSFEKELLIPLWYEIGDLMPANPQSKAAAHLWRWADLLPLAEQAGRIVAVGRGGERRAIALANPSLGGRPYIAPNLWCAIQYLGPGETAPYHRHTQNAFRFVVEGQGVWTLVNGDSVAMQRGDFLPQGSWNWHAHHNPSGNPMAWIDGLDIPFQYAAESTFFEFGPEELDNTGTPELSDSEKLWRHGGLTPLTAAGRTSPSSPLLAYRWSATDAALTGQLEVARNRPEVLPEPGHAAVRYTNPQTARDVLPTIRTEIHRITPGTETTPIRRVGSSVYQVFDGSGRVRVGEQSWSVTRGDLFVVPSWQQFSVTSTATGSDSDSGALDLFTFSDAPIFEALNLYREQENA
ncbi:cupin domain-containing protein [Enemella evansiae]|uniref:cupin domain-containing protein n=1 Tax=Enemella evansiae TaxID=2016499 RepID=UPI001E518367|nr:cupin domain-containing protein [Enemella evansiae]